jgi:RNA polymerase sigma factor (sigma-70 family)
MFKASRKAAAAARRRARTLRKLRPTAKLPADAVLRALSDEDRAILMKRLTEVAECLLHPVFPRSPSFEALERAVSLLDRRNRKRATPAPRLKEVSAGGSEVLTADAERQLFLTFNYCRYRVMRILHRFRGRRLDAINTRELLRWERLADEKRTEIVRANTSLVLAMARRAKNVAVELAELVSEGNLALLRCVDKFDASRGFKFSTYACRAILASFSRAATKATRTRILFPTTYDPSVERSDYLERKRERIELECIEELRQILVENSAELSSVERRVLDARFSLDQDAQHAEPAKRLTLDQVGVLLGVSKERVRQIQNQAIDKLRAVLEGRIAVAS